MSLITSSQVIEAAPVDHNFDPKFVTPHINKVEFRHLIDDDTGCLGRDFYDALAADQKTYVQFDTTTTFTAGTNVVYDGTLWVNSVDTTGKIPGTDPEWTSTPLFTTALYQTLWDDYLCELLSFMVIHASVFKTSFRLTSSGVLQKVPDGTKAASVEGVKILKDELMDDIETLFRRMDQFLTHEDNKESFPLYKANAESCVDGKCEHRGAGLGVFLDHSPSGGSDYYNLEND